MLRAAARWSARVEELAARTRRLSDVTRLVNWRCDGVYVADPGPAVASVARRWSDAIDAMSRVARDLANADSDKMSLILDHGVESPEDALWLATQLGLFESEVDDPSVAVLGLTAIGPDLDTARDRVRNGGGSIEGDGVISLEDLRAMAHSELFDIEQRNIAARVLEYVEADESRVGLLGLKGDGFSWSELGSLALAAGGFVPVLGDAIDAGFVAYYLAKGDLANAGVHAVGLVPLPGVSGTGVRGAREAAERLATTATKNGAKDVATEVAQGTVENFVEDQIAAGAGEAVLILTGDEDLADIASLATGVVLEGGFPEARTTEEIFVDHYSDFAETALSIASREDD